MLGVLLFFNLNVDDLGGFYDLYYVLKIEFVLGVIMGVIMSILFVVVLLVLG